MKSSLALLAVVVFANIPKARACSTQTIDTIVSSINPYQTSGVGAQFEQSLSTLQLCDENIFYAGQSLGETFNPYQVTSTSLMSDVIVKYAKRVPSEFAQGLGLSLISGLNLYQYNSSIYMMRALLNLGSNHREHAKQFALELLQQQNPYQTSINEQLLEAVRILQGYAQGGGSGGTPGNGGEQGSYWSFRSRPDSCGFESGPWGDYELCPRYLASVADRFGNRVVLTCKAGSAGIDFRVSLGRDAWSRIEGQNIETLGFGTTGSVQSMGIPYVIRRDKTLLAEEVLAPEVLSALSSGSKLDVVVRLNSGESNMNLQFTLKGSNKAIKELQKVCR